MIDSLKIDLQTKFFNLDDIDIKTIYDYFKKYNAYLVGKYITNLYLKLDENIDTIDIFISNNNIVEFLLNFSKDFKLERLNFESKKNNIYYDKYDDIYSIDYIIYYDISKYKYISIYVYPETEGNIDDVLNKYSTISLFEVWWDFDKKITPFMKEKKYKINDKCYDDYIKNGLTKQEYDFYIGKGIDIEEPNKIKKPELNYKDIEKEIIKELIYEPLFNDDIIKELNDKKSSSKIINQDIYLKIFNSINSEKIKRDNSIYIQIILSIILIVKLNNNFTYNDFIRAINEIYNPKIPIFKIKEFIENIITNSFLDNYNINIDIKKNKIKFNIDNIEKSKLTTEEVNYIKNILLFYYKNRIFKYIGKYDFLNIIVEKFKLLDLNYNLQVKTTFDKSLITLSNVIMSMFRRKTKLSIKQSKQILEHNSEINYDDLINGYKVENVKEFLNEDEENILIVDSSRKNITCISKTDLNTMISDFTDNWFYDCNKFNNDEYLLQPYIKIPTTTETYYIKYQYLYALFKSNNKLFYLNKTGEKIEKTASYKNTPKGQREGVSIYVGANHCQEGSYIELSTISIINEEIKTKEKTIVEKRISLNKSITISSE